MCAASGLRKHTDDLVCHHITYRRLSSSYLPIWSLVSVLCSYLSLPTSIRLPSALKGLEVDVCTSIQSFFSFFLFLFLPVFGAFCPTDLHRIQQGDFHSAGGCWSESQGRKHHDQGTDPGCLFTFFNILTSFDDFNISSVNITWTFCEEHPGPFLIHWNWSSPVSLRCFAGR